jgi:ribosomal protein L18
MQVQLVNKNGIIMMNIRFNYFIDVIAKKKRLVVKINFNIHNTAQVTRDKAQVTLTSEISLSPEFDDYCR